MQSTKEEVTWSSPRMGVRMSYGQSAAVMADTEETSLLLLSVATASGDNREDDLLLLPTVWEKLLVVLLVAAGTVCVLTNVLILTILLRQKGQLCLRYQIMTSQAWAGLCCTSPVVVYPLKMVSLVLLDPSHSSSRLKQSDAAFFSSQYACLLVCSAPLVSSALLSTSHSLALFAEQSMSHLKHSPQFARTVLLSLWVLPVSLSLLPMFGIHQYADFCYLSRVWTRPYSWLLLLLLVASLALAALSLSLARMLPNRNSKATNEDKNPFCGGSNGGGQKKTKMTVVIIQSSNCSSSSHSKPFEQKKSSLFGFSVTVLLALPAIIHSANFGGSSEDLLKTAENDSFLPWFWLLVVLSGAFTPMLHLLSDDVISGLGLQLFKSCFQCFCFNRRCFKVEETTEGGGTENDAFSATSI